MTSAAIKMAAEVRVDDVRTVNESDHSRHLDAIEAAECLQLGSLPHCDFKALAAVVKGSHIERQAVGSDWSPVLSVDRLPARLAISGHLHIVDRPFVTA
jgi:hypothetical protein